MAMAAVDVLPAVAEIDAQELFEEAPTDPVHRFPDRQLDQTQPFPGGAGQADGRELAEPFYLGRELCLEALVEPAFFTGPSPGEAIAAICSGGRSSQICSLTSMTSRRMDRNRW